MTKTLNIRVVGIASAGAKDEEVTAAGTLAHPSESRIQVVASSHQCKTGARLGVDILGITQAQILIVLAGGGRTARHEWESEPPAHNRQPEDRAKEVALLPHVFYQMIFAPNWMCREPPVPSTGFDAAPKSGVKDGVPTASGTERSLFIVNTSKLG